MSARWPTRLWVVRHGESTANIARDRAYAAGAARIEVKARDVDVELSALGEHQALTLGRWFAELAPDERPEVVLTSPYVRAQETARLIAEAGGVAPEATRCVDERLRERELGVLNGLTRAGVVETMPEEAARLTLLGKFYHRPPGGESWCDVILRLRSAVDTLSLHHAGRRVLIVAHQAVILCARYLLEGLDEEQILAIDARADVANCSITEYALTLGQDGREKLELVRYNFTTPLEQAGAPVTTAPDAKVAAR
jgi:broad specificity phosphatase PhoE